MLGVSFSRFQLGTLDRGGGRRCLFASTEQDISDRHLCSSPRVSEILQQSREKEAGHSEGQSVSKSS